MSRRWLPLALATVATTACGDGGDGITVAGGPLVAMAEGEMLRLPISGGPAILGGGHPGWAVITDGVLVLDPECDVLSGPSTPRLFSISLIGSTGTTTIQVQVARSIVGACGLQVTARRCDTNVSDFHLGPTEAVALCVTLDSKDAAEPLWIQPSSDLPSTKLAALPSGAEVTAISNTTLVFPLAANPSVVGRFQIALDVFRADPDAVLDQAPEHLQLSVELGAPGDVGVELFDTAGLALAAIPPVAELANQTFTARLWYFPQPQEQLARCVRVDLQAPNPLVTPFGRRKSAARISTGGAGGVGFAGDVLCTTGTPELTISVSPGAGDAPIGSAPAVLRFDLRAADGVTPLKFTTLPLDVVDMVDDWNAARTGQPYQSACAAADGELAILAIHRQPFDVHVSTVVDGWPVASAAATTFDDLRSVASMTIAGSSDAASIVALRATGPGNRVAVMTPGTGGALTLLGDVPAVRGEVMAGFRTTIGHGVTHLAVLGRDAGDHPVLNVVCVASDGLCSQATARVVTFPGAPVADPAVGVLTAVDSTGDGVDDFLIVLVNHAGGVQAWRVTGTSLGDGTTLTAAPAVLPLGGSEPTGVARQIVFMHDQIDHVIALIDTDVTGLVVFQLPYALVDGAGGPSVVDFLPPRELAVVHRSGQSDALVIATDFGMFEVVLQPGSLRVADPIHAEEAGSGTVPAPKLYGEGLAICARSGPAPGGPLAVFTVLGEEQPSFARYRIADLDAVIAGPWPDQPGASP